MPSALNLWQPANAPDTKNAPALDLGGFAGAYIGGKKAMDDSRAVKAGYSDARLAGGTGLIGTFSRGILEGRAAAKEMSDPMGELKKTLAEQNAAMNALQLQEAVDRRQETIATKAKSLEFGQMLDTYIGAGVANTPQAEDAVLGWLARNPQAAMSPQIKSQLQFYQQSRGYLDAQAKIATQRGVGVLNELQPGQSLNIPGVGNASVDLPRSGLTGMSAEPEIFKAENGVEFRRNTTGGWTPLPARLEAPRTLKATDAVTGAPISILQTGPNSYSRVTPSPAQNAAETTIASSADIIAKGRQLLPLINDRTTGIKGGLQRVLRDSGLGLAFPGSMDPQVSEADAVAREFAAGIVRGLRSDGNINEKEYQSLQGDANTLRWVDERTGKTRLATFVEGAMTKARDASKRLGRPIAEPYLTIDELAARAEAKIEAGEMTKDAAIKWANAAWSDGYEKFVEDIRASIDKTPKK